jgi:hypothetical protein
MAHEPTPATAERKTFSFEKETSCDVLYLDNPIEGLRGLIVELRPGQRKDPNARTIPLCEPPTLQIPTAQGVINVKLNVWLSPQAGAKRAPVMLG